MLVRVISTFICADLRSWGSGSGCRAPAVPQSPPRPDPAEAPGPAPADAGDVPHERLADSAGGSLTVTTPGPPPSPKSNGPLTLEFLAVLQEPTGWLGGYLVTNGWGRPLEFRLTTAVQPNRVQTALYGPTLTEYLHADVIGKTLIEKTGTKPDLIVTDSPPALALRSRIEIPVISLGVQHGRVRWPRGRSQLPHPRAPGCGRCIPAPEVRGRPRRAHEAAGPRGPGGGPGGTVRPYPRGGGRGPQDGSDQPCGLSWKRPHPLTPSPRGRGGPDSDSFSPPSLLGKGGWGVRFFRRGPGGLGSFDLPLDFAPDTHDLHEARPHPLDPNVREARLCSPTRRG